MPPDQRVEMDARQGHDAGVHGAVRFVGVVVRATGHGETEPLREMQIPRAIEIIVIRVIRLDGVEPRVRKLRNPLVVIQKARVRERGEAAGLVNLARTRRPATATAAARMRAARATAICRTPGRWTRRNPQRPLRGRPPAVQCSSRDRRQPAERSRRRRAACPARSSVRLRDGSARRGGCAARRETIAAKSMRRRRSTRARARLRREASS